MLVGEVKIYLPSFFTGIVREKRRWLKHAFLEVKKQVNKKLSYIDNIPDVASFQEIMTYQSQLLKRLSFANTMVVLI